jgi:hypothetical protein
VLNENKSLDEQLIPIKGDEGGYHYKLKSDYVINFLRKEDDFAFPKTLTLNKGSLGYFGGHHAFNGISFGDYDDEFTVFIWCHKDDFNVMLDGYWAYYSNPTLLKNIRKLFCNGNSTKTGKEVQDFMKKIDKPKETPKKDSRCKFTEKEFKNEQVCFISKDNTWMYAKTDDGKWYTSKQSDRNTWCELTTPKFQTAIDKLNVECKGLMPIPKLELKPISPI